MKAKLLPLIPAHQTYVEPFGGGASLLFAKAPSSVEVYNDLDSGLVNLFRVLRSRELFPEFQRLVSLTPYAREEYDHCRETWEDEREEVERAYKFFVVARMSFAGRFGASFGTAINESSRGMAKQPACWCSCIERLPEIHERLMRVQIEHQDWRTILDRYDTLRTFFYLDPPYLASTRRSGGYRCEMSDADHRDLVQHLLRIEGMALLSGYPNEIYAPLVEAGWSYREWAMSCRAAARTRATGIQGAGSATKMQPRTEAVWASPRNQAALPLFQKEGGGL